MKVNATTDRCIFLTTPFRSGSALLSRILSAHPSIAMSYDTVNFFRFCYHRYDPISQTENAARLFEDMAHRLYNRFELKLDTKQCMTYFGDDDRSYGQAYLSILKSLFPAEDKTILGDKEPLAWTRIPSFLEMCPKGKAIVILRDPRDVVVSFKKLTIAPEHDYLIALFNVIDAVNQAFRLQHLHPERVIAVRFEQLKTNMEHEVRRLCAFLEVDFSPRMLDVDKYTDHSGNKWDSQAASIFPEEHQNPLAPVGRWRSRIEPEDLFLCEWIAGEQIARLGLPFDGRIHSPKVFERAIQKLMSSPLLRDAFQRWCDLGEGMEKFPLDPLDPTTWDPDYVARPEVFAKDSGK